MNGFFDCKNNTAEAQNRSEDGRCPNQPENEMVPALHAADFGIVAHEVGTMRMKCSKDSKGAVNGHLKL